MFHRASNSREGWDERNEGGVGSQGRGRQGERNGIASAGQKIRKWREEVSHYSVITRNNVDLMRGFKYRL